MNEDFLCYSLNMSGRLLPITTRGNAASVEREFKGTDKAIWTKYLKVFHKHSSMTEENWNKTIVKAGKVRAKSYA